MWISKSGQNDLGKRDLGLWSNLQGVTFPAAGAEPRERWTNSRGGLIDRNWNWWKISCFWWRNIKCLAKFGILEYDFRRTSCFENCKKQSIKSIWIILVLIFIENKLNLFNFESAIAKSNYVCVKLKDKWVNFILIRKLFKETEFMIFESWILSNDMSQNFTVWRLWFFSPGQFTFEINDKARISFN